MDIPRDQGVAWGWGRIVLLVLFVCLSVIVFVRATTIFWTAGWLFVLPFLSRPQRRRAARVFAGGFVLLLLAPVDVTLETQPGLPKFVPVSYEIPSESTVEKARRGELMLGATCGGIPYPPRWVLVW